jgi:hypothetical protein
MVIIGEVLVEEEIATERFSCDIARCKGACCTIEGGRGAPLLDEEKALIERYLPVVRKHLSPRGITEIGRKGPTDGFPGNHATTCIDDRDCVFVIYDGDVAMCAIEHAFRKGEIPWRKPVSCHLFPLRYSGAAPGMLRYEPVPECSPGRRKGMAETTGLHDFLKEALIRRLGSDWYARFRGWCTDKVVPASGTPGR